MNTVKSYIVGSNNGDIQNKIYEGDRLNIVRKETTDFLKDTVEIDNGGWVRLFTKSAQRLSKSLNGSEMLVVMHLASYIDYTTGMLRHSNGQILKRTAIIRDTGFNEKTVDKILKSLREKQVISKNKVGREIQYFANPFIFMKGKRVNKTLYDMFKNTKWANM